MKLSNRPVTLEHILLYVSVIFLLLAHYVVNMNPWEHIFRLTALIALAGVVAIVIPDRFPRRRSRESHPTDHKNATR